jgi:enamine deaminase RidA (YjgF/YER057c/UK114 family)
MEKKVIHVPELFPYTHYGFENCVTLGQLIFITGQAGMDKEGNIVAEDIKAQSEASFRNIKHALKAAGSDLSKILSMTCYIVDIEKNGPSFWEVRKKMIPSQNYTSATIGVAALANPKLIIEVQCIAYH